MSDQQLVAAAFVSEEGHKQLGVAMADALYESANRPGFVRTLVFHMNNHTVDEFTRDESIKAARILRRHRLSMSRRTLIRQLRTLCNV